MPERCRRVQEGAGDVREVREGAGGAGGPRGLREVQPTIS